MPRREADVAKRVIGQAVAFNEALSRSSSLFVGAGVGAGVVGNMRHLVPCHHYFGSKTSCRSRLGWLDLTGLPRGERAWSPSEASFFRMSRCKCHTTAVWAARALH